MSRIATALSCDAKVMTELVRRSNSRVTDARTVVRAKLILACIAGRQNIDIGHEFGLQASTVGLWRNRFAKSGLDGLEDLPRSGKPSSMPPDLRAQILNLLESPPPPLGQASWDGRTLAGALGVSDDAIWRILRHEGIQLQRQRTWCISTDPEFSAKSADVIGLYLNPPENALVICVDEKPSIQALQRKTGYVETSSGKVVRGLQSTYKRHGTINLFAALNVATGVVQSKTTASKKRVDFQAFMDDVVAETGLETEIHVIVDNYSTHKNNDAWLSLHPNVHFHFTPTSASWLNQIEIWFGILTRKALKGASFESEAALVQAIEAFCKAHNERAAPFVWRKREVKGSQLRNTIANLRN